MEKDLPILELKSVQSHIPCKCGERTENNQQSTINEAFFVDAYNKFFMGSPLCCKRCSRAMNFDFFVSQVRGCKGGGFHWLYSMLGAQLFIMQFELLPDETYVFDVSKIIGENFKLLSIGAHGDGGYNGIWPAIDLNHFFNLSPMYNDDSKLRIFSAVQLVESKKVECQRSTLTGWLNVIHKADIYGDYYLYESLLKAIQLFYQNKFDDFFILAGYVIDSRARIANLRSERKTNEITGQMPEDLKNKVESLKKEYRNRIKHRNIGPINFSFDSAAEFLAATILAFYYYRFYEGGLKINSQHETWCNAGI